jgi:hypothetical protein
VREVRKEKRRKDGGWVVAWKWGKRRLVIEMVGVNNRNNGNRGTMETMKTHPPLVVKAFATLLF